jgi:Zn-dependent peptidase ImmA (M78 family)
MGDKAFITPSVMKWARETARMTLDIAAEKIGVSARRLAEWESGLDKPTVAQAKKAANIYRRPFAVLMLPEPPYDFTPLREFRRKRATPLGTAAVFIIRELQEKQAWAHEWMGDQGEKPLPFVGRFSLTASPATVAADMVKELSIKPPYAEPLKEWLVKAEAKGIFISRTSYLHSHLTLDSDEFQGFAIADPFAPFIFINTDDWTASQLFTLVHELAHLWIAESGVSCEIHPDLPDESDLDPVEHFCNQVAANALMSKAYMDQIPSDVFASAEEVFNYAKKLGVSSFAFFIRASQLGLIGANHYQRLKMEADAAFRSFVDKEAAKMKTSEQNRSGPDHHRMQTYRNGLSFSRMVMDAFRGGLIPPTLASRLLGARINDFEKMEKFAYP